VGREYDLKRRLWVVNEDSIAATAAGQNSGCGLRRQNDAPPCLIVSDAPMPYRNAMEHRMTLLSKIFTTRTLVQIIFVLTAMVVMKAMSSHYDFSWASALAAG
jgi:hypothetical protein